MSKYGLTGNFKAQTGQGAQLAAILLEASKMVSTAKGCQLYLVAQDNQNQDIIWVIEVWDSQLDHDNSLGLPGVQKLISQARPLIAELSASTAFEVIGGAGIEFNP